MSVKLQTVHHLKSLSLKGGCTGSSESTLVKIPHCLKSHVAAHICQKWPLIGLKILFCSILFSRENQEKKGPVGRKVTLDLEGPWASLGMWGHQEPQV